MAECIVFARPAVRRLTFATVVDERGCLVPIEYSNPDPLFVSVRS
jgi:hypothetical protein